MNTKYIKIILFILIIFVIVFGFITITNNKNKTIINNTETSTSTDNSRMVLNTKNITNDNGEVINDYYTSSTSTQNNNTEKIDNIKSLEEIKLQNIEKKLFDWELTKDITFLNEALKLTENADNEAYVDKWSTFMSKNSSELIKMINSSTDIKKDSLTAYSIFDWYINFNSEYKKLSNIKRQEIDKQYKQLKSYLNIK